MRLIAGNPLLRRVQLPCCIAVLAAVVVLTVRVGNFAYHTLRYPTLDLDAHGTIRFDPVTQTPTEVPEWLRRMDGRRVGIEGYLNSLDFGAGGRTSECQFFRHLRTLGANQRMNYTVGVQDRLVCRARPGEHMQYHHGRVRVEGVFHVSVEGDGADCTLFCLTPDAIQPLPVQGPAPWPYVAIGIALPAMAMILIADTMIARRRAARGHCEICGYDLRATPARCPECGTVPVRVKGEDFSGSL